MGSRLLIIGAHSPGFVCRAARIIALLTSQGGSATAIALSYRERRESCVLWKEPDQTVEDVERIRHEHASEAAGTILGAASGWPDMGGYPLIRASEARSQRGARLREERLAGRMSYELRGLC